MGASSPSPTWYCAEGTVRPGFVEYLTLQNPGTVSTVATLAFQVTDDGGAPLGVPNELIAVPAGSRVTVRVNDYTASHGVAVPVNVAATVTSSEPIVAERPLYFDADPGLGRVVDGGHDVMFFLIIPPPPRSTLVPYPPLFRSYLTLQNPGTVSTVA